MYNEHYRAAYYSLPYSLVEGSTITPVISDVIINQEMAEKVTDVGLRRQFNPDVIIRNSARMTFGTVKGPRYIYQSPTMHRASISVFEMKPPFVDEYQSPYCYVSPKGDGYSYRSLFEHCQVTGNDFRADLEKVTRKYDPLGLFGYQDAKQEMVVSNQLAAAGARTNRVIAILALNPDGLRKYYESLKLDPTMYPFLHFLSTIRSAKEVPAICVRLIAGDTIGDLFDTLKYQTIFSSDRMIHRSIRLIEQEMKLRGPKQFIERYDLPESLDYLSPVTYLLRGSQLVEDYATYIHLLLRFKDYNMTVKNRVSSKHYQGKLRAHVDHQEAGLAGHWRDYETWVPGCKQYQSDDVVTYSPLLVADNLSYLSSGRRKEIKDKASELDAKYSRRQINY